MPQPYLTHSYLTLRKALGWIGILLPFTLLLGDIIIFGEDSARGSISLYYHSGMRDVFVGGVCSIALFLFFYRGYDKADSWVSNLAGFFALLVAFFPTTENGPLDISGEIHFYSASFFFVLLAGMSLFLFTKKAPGYTQKKLVRNKIYIACGIVMLVCLLSIAVYFRIYDMQYSGSSFVFWTEAAALIAFGVSWLTKGGTILPDRKIGECNEAPEGL